VGLFADGTSNYGGAWNTVAGSVTGLFYGDGGQLVAQIIGAIACFCYVFPVSLVFFKLCDRLIGLRTTAAAEVGGLDIPEMGLLAYPADFTNIESAAIQG
jgi:Amt family ammonium transporter